MEKQVEQGTNVADNTKHGLETSDTAMAGAPATGKSPAPLGADSVERGGEHGFRGGASGAEIPASGTRPSHATRHIETALGILSYAELVRIDGYIQHRAELKEIRFSTVDFSGELEITNATAFRKTLQEGLGHAKAFG